MNTERTEQELLAEVLAEGQFNAIARLIKWELTRLAFVALRDESIVIEAATLSAAEKMTLDHIVQTIMSDCKVGRTNVADIGASDIGSRVDVACAAALNTARKEANR